MQPLICPLNAQYEEDFSMKEFVIRTVRLNVVSRGLITAPSLYV